MQTSSMVRQWGLGVFAAARHPVEFSFLCLKRTPLGSLNLKSVGSRPNSGGYVPTPAGACCPFESAL